MGNTIAYHFTDPQGIPNNEQESVFDPKFGFANGRKVREMIATPEEMESAKLPLEARDYCAHLLLKYQGCRADTWPFVYKCAHEKHEYMQCEYEDTVLRMMDFEREKRLLQRKKRIEAKQHAEE